ncbi:uncharacterized protein N7498_001647 [Penicillium cinerascens]|uniref:Uncharacterized protein n=1 Tax=Penicillium cinerascens TaxID=70096 RepID=A0A9W9TB79_9EURO|nr:uncharacterized protein N7498_001647 [Penicillium cinerascens]KAJ5215240.1 hypothetical protein N7498_001647 [Penicillium cinerascens]
MKSTTLKIARAQAIPSSKLPENVGRHSRRVDTALPGKHTRQLYDRLSWKEASVLAQLRTGIINVHMDKQERPWTTFCFDAGSGPRTGRKYCNALTLTDVTCPSSWEGSHPLMIKSGSRIWKQCEPQYDLRSLRADLRPLDLANERA